MNNHLYISNQHTFYAASLSRYTKILTNTNFNHIRNMIYFFKFTKVQRNFQNFFNYFQRFFLLNMLLTFMLLNTLTSLNYTL